tara:strand:- start:525 stop:1409 length:885 start_codon:yes stop_codon:yes gene_type:complete
MQDWYGFVSVYCTDVFLIDLRSGSIRLEPDQYQNLDDQNLIKSSGKSKSIGAVLFCYLYTVEGIAFDGMERFEKCGDLLDSTLIGKTVHLWIKKLKLYEHSIAVSVCQTSHGFSHAISYEAHLSVAPTYLYENYLELFLILSNDYEDIKIQVTRDIEMDYRLGHEFSTITLGHYTIYLSLSDLVYIVKLLQPPSVFETTGLIYVTRFKFINQKVVVISKQRHMKSFNQKCSRDLYYSQGDEAIYYNRKRSRLENIELDDYEGNLALASCHDKRDTHESVWDTVQLLDRIYLHNR